MSDREIMNAKGFGKSKDPFGARFENHPNSADSIVKKTDPNELKHMPNQKWHKIVSFIKSGVRIAGYIFIPFDVVLATCVLILSEIIGIVEELV